MKRLLSLLLDNVLERVLVLAGRNLLDSARIEAFKAYLHGVAMVRRLFLNVLCVLAGLLLLIFGVILIHVGVWFLLPWTAEVKALVFTGLGLLYMLGGGGMLRHFCSERKWLEVSGAATRLQAIQDRLRSRL